MSALQRVVTRFQLGSFPLPRLPSGSQIREGRPRGVDLSVESSQGRFSIQNGMLNLADRFFRRFDIGAQRVQPV
ncbi:MAG: hypothetical protein ACRD1H_09625, partial [Vicinamibacterales bacterium]